jgi:hypothetical protein
MEMIGFEFSPHSTHMAVSKIKYKKQFEVNEELSHKWNKEMSKRNKYFSNFGITTLTFTDIDLTDIEKCFLNMKKYLSNRPEIEVNLDEQIRNLDLLLAKKTT